MFEMLLWNVDAQNLIVKTLMLFFNQYNLGAHVRCRRNAQGRCSERSIDRFMFASSPHPSYVVSLWQCIGRQRLTQFESSIYICSWDISGT